MDVIDLLTKNNYVILGIDIWLATEPGPTDPTPFVYDWDIESAQPSGSDTSPAKEFVRCFEWDPEDRSHKGMEPYFNILAQSRDS